MSRAGSSGRPALDAPVAVEDRGRPARARDRGEKRVADPVAAAAAARRSPPRSARDQARARRSGQRLSGPGDQTPVAARPVRMVAAICLVGLVLTALASTAAARADRNTEQRLLEGQTRRAASVLSNAITNIQEPMTATLAALAATGGAGDGRGVGDPRRDEAVLFERLMSRDVGRDKSFVSASLWRAPTDLAPGKARQLASVGVAPATEPTGDAMRQLLARSLSATTSVVSRAEAGGQSRIAYVLADPASGYILYAERAIPTGRRAPVDRDSAYADLNYAIYLGEHTSTSAMTTTDVDPASLPLRGTTSRTSVPFGDTVLTLVASPRRHLGSSLGNWLPLIFLLGGLLLTLAAALTGHRLARARQRVDVLYGQQRDLSIRLQRALLPRSNPDIPGLEVAADYVAAAQGVEVGGDWYSVLSIGRDRFAFVVGDVSGHGVDAVAVMARVRFTLRAYVSDGDAPGEALRKCAAHVDIERDGHIVTALVGVGDLRTGQLTLAAAGHLPPLLVNGDDMTFAALPVGPPLGVGASDYDNASLDLPVGTVLFAYTDGLVERRDEDIDAGMDRLAAAVVGMRHAPLEVLVADVLATMNKDRHPEDDIAVVALRRNGIIDD